LKAELKGVMETHFHADFVSGHLELQKRCSVPIYFGPSAASRAKFSLHELQHGEVNASLLSHGSSYLSVDYVC